MKSRGKKKKKRVNYGHLRPDFSQYVVISLIDGLQTRFQLVGRRDPHKINIFLGAIHNRGCSFRGFYNRPCRPDFIAFPLLMPLGEPLISP